MKKQLLLQKLSVIEGEEDQDYKLVRGLSTLLERSCVFEVRSAVDPRRARGIVFELASRRSAATLEQTEGVLSEASSILSISRDDLDKSLWADLEGELFLKEFIPPTSPDELIKRYNLSLVQTALFKCSRMEFTASGNWKNIFRSLKWLGLMYSIEKTQGSSSSSFQAVSLDGPMSLFKMTDRYGTAVARLLPEIVKSDSWTIKAELVERKKNRILSFEESSEHLRGMLIAQEGAETQDRMQFDSSVEERFARKFNALGTGWILKREPEPLAVSEEQTGRQSVIIPDFSFEMPEMKEGGETKNKKVYLEIVGFWTHEYMQRKLAKISSVLLTKDYGADLLVAVDESLSCSGKFAQLATLTNNSNKVILYKNGNVPLQPIASHLESIKRAIDEEQINKLMKTRIDLNGDVVSIEDIAKIHHVSLEVARSALNLMNFPEYLRVGDYYLSNSKVYEARARIKRLLDAEESRVGTSETKNDSSGTSLAEAVALIESMGLPVEANQLLDALGYSISWNGLDYGKSKVVRPKQEMSSAATV